jgi:FdhD protein
MTAVLPDHNATIDRRGAARREVVRVERGDASTAHDWLAEEVPVQVSVNGKSFAVMMATPLDLEDFAWGFAASEGLLAEGAVIRDVHVREHFEGITLNIVAEASARAQDERPMPGRSGCGICGSRLLEDVVRQPDPVQGGPVIDDGAVERALGMLRERQPMNLVSGAVHAAAWANEQGEIALVREDVGRHNALDKLTGAMARTGVDVSRGFAVVTSRASYEMVTKAASAGIAILVAISAPTALAVQLAKSCAITLVGFARPGRHVVYSGGERVRRTQPRSR